MTDDYIREGDIVEIDYITEFTKEHINEGKALVIWKGFNNQPLVRKLDTKATIWTCYEHIVKVVGHIDIVGYMDRALSAEPCEDCISRQAAKDIICSGVSIDTDADKEYVCELIDKLPSVTPKEKTGKWYKTGLIDKVACSNCKSQLWDITRDEVLKYKYCPNCGAKMEVEHDG